MKKKNLIIVIIVILVLVVIINAIFYKLSDQKTIIDPTESLVVDNYEITVDDYYEADYLRTESLDYSFDKYLAVDLIIKNIGETKDKFMALGHFRLDDGNYDLKSIVIDEYGKKFAKELYPEDEFAITLVFPVDNSNMYTLYYNKTLKAEDEESVGFSLDGTNLAKEKVEHTIDHTNILSKKKDEEEETEEESQTEKAQEVLDVAGGEDLADEIKGGTDEED